MQKKNLFKIFLPLLVLFHSVSLEAQEVIKEGFLPSIEYILTGPSHYKSNSELVHALAYANSIDVGDIKASRKYSVSYRVIKLAKGGFQTEITIRPKEAIGHLSFYQFNRPKIVLPELESLKLYYSNNGNLIYVKELEGVDSNTPFYVYKFCHQRFSKDWNLALENLKWEFKIGSDEFINIWDWMNDYQSAFILLEAESKLSNDINKTFSKIHKQRWLAIYVELEKMDFYTELIINSKQDPLYLEKKLSIRKFVLAREISQLEPMPILDSMKVIDLADIYFQSELDFFNIAQEDNGLYSDLYMKFSDNASHLFCLQSIDSIFNRSLNKDKYRKQFDLLYQKNSMSRMFYFVENKLPNWALYQIEKFESFFNKSEFLKSSTTYQRYKAKAVYDIYLSYIEVAKQAIEHDKVTLAMSYLDEASLIQKKYPKEIINDMYVNKELKLLIKRALDRYKQKLESGDLETAKLIKRGVLGLIKKYNVDIDISTLQSS